MWGPLLSFLQDHEDRVIKQRLEELLRVHTGAVFIQHHRTGTLYTQRVACLSERGEKKRTGVRHVESKWAQNDITQAAALQTCLTLSQTATP